MDVQLACLDLLSDEEEQLSCAAYEIYNTVKVYK